MGMTEPEPNGWELMRSIDALRDSVDKLAAGMVSQATLTLVTQAQLAVDTRQDARIRALETELAEARKTKAQQWFAIGLALFGLVCTIVGGVVVFSINQGGAP